MSRVQLGLFSIDAPRDWRLSTVILAGPVDEPTGPRMPTTKALPAFQRNLVATMEEVDGKMTLDAYLKRQIDGLKQAGVTRQDAGKPERVKLSSGADGLIAEQIILGSGGERVRQMQLIVIKNGVAHTVIASHSDGAAFESARAELRTMLLSFE